MHAPTTITSLFTRSTRRQILGGIAVLIGWLGSTACQGAPPNSSPPPAQFGAVYATPGTSQNSNPPVGQDGAVWVTAESLPHLVSTSDLIVLGVVRATGDVINGCRASGDYTKPDPTQFCAAQVYHIEVDRYLKGDGGRTLEIAQTEGASLALPVTKDQIEQSRARFTHVPLGVGKHYLLFLRRIQLDKVYFTGPSHPWRFVLGANGMAEAESPWRGAPGRFPSRSSTALIAEVERLVAGQPPAPTPTIAPPPPKPGQPATPPGK